MDKFNHYLDVFQSFKRLCSQGNQPCSFRAFCSHHRVDASQMRYILKSDFQPLSTLSGYRAMATSRAHTSEYESVYEDFKNLCAEGRQQGSFSEYCKCRGFVKSRLYMYLHRKGLSIVGLPGYRNPSTIRGYAEIPFEEVIFEEAGFLPAQGGNVITVNVDGRVAVSFPADTDVDVIARFVAKTRKEAGNVGA